MTYANTETTFIGYVHSQYHRVTHGYTCIETPIHKLSVHVSSYGGSEHDFTGQEGCYCSTFHSHLDRMTPPLGP